ncbi:MAG: hypothetical protein RL701_6302 [Pseudomonadota bacterium]|jgi:hypothetical protein
MAQGKPAERILTEVSRLGSSLAELATRELEVVLNDLKGERGSTNQESDADIGAGRVNLGTVSVNAMQLLAKVGEFVTELSKYDLIRNDIPRLTLRATNPISSHSVQTSDGKPYFFLLENDGENGQSVAIAASLTCVPRAERPAVLPSPAQPKITPELDTIGAGERRRLALELPDQLSSGEYRLRIEVFDRSQPPKLIARKTIQVNVLPPPQQHSP